MRVLVTGGAGFIGSHVVQALVDDRAEVVVLDVRRPACAFGGIDFVLGDIRDASAVESALTGVDVVMHLAGRVGLGVDIQDMPDYASVNVDGTATLLAAMARGSVSRLVLASSMVVYGEGAYTCPRHGRVKSTPRRAADLDAGRFDPACPLCDAELSWVPVGEDSPLEPRSTYAATKTAQEHLALAWAQATAAHAVALRFHNVYGPGMPLDTPYAGVAAIFRSSLQRGQPPQVFEDGRQTRDFVHVRDVAAAGLSSRRLGLTPPGQLEPFNVASGTPHTLADMARALADAFGGPDPVVTGRWRAGDVRHVVASADRAKAALGFQASVTFADGMKELGSPLPVTSRQPAGAP